MKKSLLGNIPPYPPSPLNALARYASLPPANALAAWDWRPKSEYVPGYYRQVPYGLLGVRYEWVPGYWRRRAW